MYNSNIPSHMDLPSSAQLIRSTVIAAVTASVLLVTTVLPAEYGIDPTGVGRMLGLAEMGEIKASLAAEAEEDAKHAAPDAAQQRSDAGPGLWSRLAGLVIAPAAAATLPERGEAQLAQAAKSDEVSITLAPGQGSEIKLEMRKGAKVQYAWTAAGGLVNHDTHGDGGDSEHSYKKGRQVAGDEGVLEAAFDGSHGWFWRNRGKNDVTITLKTIGDYVALKQMK